MKWYDKLFQVGTTKMIQEWYERNWGEKRHLDNFCHDEDARKAIQDARIRTDRVSIVPFQSCLSFEQRILQSPIVYAE